MDEILLNLQTVFQDSATQGLPKAFESIQRTMENLENTSRTLGHDRGREPTALKGIVDNMENLTGFINDQQGNLSNALGNFSQISDSLANLELASTLKRADASIAELNRVLEGLNAGEGSLGKLLKSDSLHDGLVATNKELQFLLNDLYLNPQRYVRVSVFGGKEKRKLSEKELERLQRLIDAELDERESNATLSTMPHFIGQLVFALPCSAPQVFFFARRIGTIRRNILLGRDLDLTDRKGERWATMARVALGQSKMVVRPVAGVMHILIYVGFILINIEVLEILVDGLFGTHRVFAPFLGGLYDVLIGTFEWLALGVLVACVVFLIRRNVLPIARFRSPEMEGWPKNDANIILIVEVVLMFAFLSMNAADAIAQSRIALDVWDTPTSTSPPAPSRSASGWCPSMQGCPTRASWRWNAGAWWFHIAGILAFLVYVPYSKHFHIFLAFPNTWYSNLNPAGRLDNMAAVKKGSGPHDVRRPLRRAS